MKRLILFLIILAIGSSSFAQDIGTFYSSDAWQEKYKSFERYQDGKRSKVNNIRDAKVEIKDAGKTVYIDGVEYSKHNLTYYSNSGIIQAGRTSDQWYMYYFIRDFNLYLSVVIKAKDGNVYRETYKFSSKTYKFDELRKYAYKQ